MFQGFYYFTGVICVINCKTLQHRSCDICVHYLKWHPRAATILIRRLLSMGSQLELCLKNITPEETILSASAIFTSEKHQVFHQLAN